MDNGLGKRDFSLPAEYWTSNIYLELHRVAEWDFDLVYLKTGYGKKGV